MWVETQMSTIQYRNYSAVHTEPLSPTQPFLDHPTNTGLRMFLSTAYVSVSKTVVRGMRTESMSLVAWQCGQIHKGKNKQL